MNSDGTLDENFCIDYVDNGKFTNTIHDILSLDNENTIVVGDFENYQTPADTSQYIAQLRESYGLLNINQSTKLFIFNETSGLFELIDKNTLTKDDSAGFNFSLNFKQNGTITYDSVDFNTNINEVSIKKSTI